MFERFTQRARKVVVLAGEEFGRLRHDYIDTEHLLSGLVRESEGMAARVLSNLDVDPDAVRREVVRRLPGEEPEFGPPSEPRLEEGERSRRLFRGRVDGISADLRRTGLLEADPPILGAVITVSGGHLLGSFPATLEVSLIVSGPPEPPDQPAPTFSVSAT